MASVRSRRTGLGLASLSLGVAAVLGWFLLFPSSNGPELAGLQLGLPAPEVPAAPVPRVAASEFPESSESGSVLVVDPRSEAPLGQTPGAEEPARRLDLRGPEGARVSGRVLDQDGVPVGRARVRLLLSAREWKEPVDALGQFLFEGLEPGRYRLVVDGRSLPEGYLPPWRQQVTGGASGSGMVVQLRSGAESVVDLQVFQAARVLARIVGEEGQPIEGARVSLRSGTGHSASTKTDGRGEFELGGLYPGTYRAAVHIATGADGALRALPTSLAVELAPGEVRQLADIVVSAESGGE